MQDIQAKHEASQARSYAVLQAAMPLLVDKQRQSIIISPLKALQADHVSPLI